jgi:RNA polymerase sigma-70 factor (ECF subfamily)
MMPLDGSDRSVGAEPIGCVVREPGEGMAPADLSRRIAEELPFLRSIARRWVRERSNADDLVQDTALQALANAHLWQPGSNLRGWLFTIMRNQFFAARIKTARFDPDAAIGVLAEAAAPAGQAEARLLIRDVERALRRLPWSQRTALSLIGIDGKSYDEAAGEMGLSVAAVRCHLARGRERLRNAVNGTGDITPIRRAPPPSSVPTRAMAMAAE